MTKMILSLLCAATLIVSCTDITKPAASSPPVATVETPTEKSLTPQTMCFALRLGKDITAIEMTVDGDAVSGFYAREPDQKDAARGALTGKKTGDRIEGLLTYMIEGMVQSEEVVFKQVGDKLMQGTGELMGDMGNTTLKDKTKLTWTDSFAPTDCTKIKEPIARAKKMAAMIAQQK